MEAPIVGLSDETDNDYHWIIKPSSVKQCQGLALGNFRCATNQEFLSSSHILAIITVMGESELIVQKKIKHLRIVINDDPSENIKCFFESTCRFIKQYLEIGNVLVHCKAGVSRSTTIVCSYLIKEKLFTYDEAIKTVREARNIAEPNKGFVKQLKEFAREIEEKKKTDYEKKCSIY